MDDVVSLFRHGFPERIEVLGGDQVHLAPEALAKVLRHRREGLGHFGRIAPGENSHAERLLRCMHGGHQHGYRDRPEQQTHTAACPARCGVWPQPPIRHVDGKRLFFFYQITPPIIRSMPLQGA
jgi:hypothetical protein